VAYADSALVNAALGDPGRRRSNLCRGEIPVDFANPRRASKKVSKTQIYSLKPNPLMNFRGDLR
jgi:hypothetical protein